MSGDPTLFEEETRPTFRDPIYRLPRNNRPIETVTTQPYLSARRTDPATSVEAAKQLTGKIDRAMYFHLKVTGKAYTTDELAKELGFYPDSVSTAMSRLVRDGYAVRVGDGRSSRGRECGLFRVAV
jgi:hypothetical protein